MCISKETKKVILLILSGNPNLFLDLKRYHSLEHAEPKKYFFLVRYLFCKGKLMVWFLQLSLWSKILALNMKEIKIWQLSWQLSIDWYDKNYRALFCVSLDTGMRLRRFTLWFERKQHILVAQLTQKSVRILRPGDNLQNGATLTQRCYGA